MFPCYCHWSRNLLFRKPLEPNLFRSLSPKIPCPWFTKSFWNPSRNLPLPPILPWSRKSLFLQRSPPCQRRLPCHVFELILSIPLWRLSMQISISQSWHLLPFSKLNDSSLHSGGINCSVHGLWHKGIFLPGITIGSFLVGL